MISLVEITEIAPPFTFAIVAQGPYRLDAAQVFVAGADESQAFQAGQFVAECFSAGATDAQASL